MVRKAAPRKSTTRRSIAKKLIPMMRPTPMQTTTAKPTRRKSATKARATSDPGLTYWLPVPHGSNALSSENMLQHHPGIGSDKPWLIYDMINPAAQFRKTPADYDWTDPLVDIPEGDDLTDLTDNFEEGRTIPVHVYGYEQRHVVRLTEGTEGEQPFAEYEKSELCKISIWDVKRKESLTAEQRETEFPTEEELENERVFSVHAGYRRVLAGFRREIEFVTKDHLTSHNALFRATYLTKVLDIFAAEVMGMAKSRRPPARFRSRALNPILQRQLRGVYDHEPDMIKREVGKSLGEAADFYLKLDPLDPKFRTQMMKGVLYVWTARLSLLNTPMTETMYEGGLTNTLALLPGRGRIPDDEYSNESLYDFEAAVVKNELLTEHYSELMQPMDESD